MPDNLAAAILLGSLPESYETFVTALESRSENELSTQFVKSKLIDEHKRRKGAKEVKENFTEAAMKAAYKDHDRAQPRGNCFFCKKSGHFKSECAKYKIWKAKQEKANKVSNQKPPMDHCFYAKDGTEKELCYGATTTKGRTNSWVVDSGATSHMATTREFFHEFLSDRKGHSSCRRTKGGQSGRHG